MIKNNSKSLKKFISIFIANLVGLFLIAGIISNLKGFHLNDVLFIEGLLSLMIVLFSSVGGNYQSLSLQEFGQVNPQYFANILLESNAIEKEKIASASNIQINMDLISSSLMIGSIIVLISSYLL
ncbi:hypothetical protein [Clostridium sp.]|uniref:hypothetical protein n=1 Tax=Clostridium sp. TaxID=1506 RepID=UPI0025C4FD58|nr:hypothetical protein [Clostridium sp.]